MTSLSAMPPKIGSSPSRSAKLLKESGITCWIAPRDIQFGEVYSRAIVTAIRNCRAMVVVFSAHANQSDDIVAEVNGAFRRRIPIVPFRIEDAELSADLDYYLSSRHWLNAMTTPREPHLGQLATHLGRTLALPVKPQPSIPVQAVPQAGELTTNPEDGQPYVWIPPGSFQMGAHRRTGNAAPTKTPGIW